MLKEFMGKTSEEIDLIEKMLPKNTNIDAAIKAKSDFYSMCSRNKNINGNVINKNNIVTLEKGYNINIYIKIKTITNLNYYKFFICNDSIYIHISKL